MKTPQISSSLSLRLIGMFAGQFVNLAFFMSFALRVRAWAVKREGNTEQFVKVGFGGASSMWWLFISVFCRISPASAMDPPAPRVPSFSALLSIS